MKRLSGLVFAAVVMSGCGASLQQLRTRAALDFDCAEGELSVREVDTGTRMVTGCGRRAIYVVQFNNARYPAWLLNSEIKPAREVSLAE